MPSQKQFKSLDDVECYVLIHRINAHSFAAIATWQSLSVKRVRQIEKEALQKLGWWVDRHTPRPVLPAAIQSTPYTYETPTLPLLR